MEKNLAKTYNPKDFENRIYDMWEENHAFRAERDENKKSFTIVIPPPNITGQLHMGHALDQTLQDVLIRWKRMQGFSALWLPGSDHASIATEVKVVDKIREEEGKTKEGYHHPISRNFGKNRGCGDGNTFFIPLHNSCLGYIHIL
jgi:valyl-tRNA synthetase